MFVAGIDSSTQSCKVLVCRADDGSVVRAGHAPHPTGTSCPPQAWWAALEQAVAEAGGLDDVAAIAVGGQQHGMVCLDGEGEVIRDALLWNDTRSAEAAAALVDELGAERWAEATGSVPVASFTVTKLRWLAEHEPEHASRIAAICLPHDWLTWKLSGSTNLESLVTDRSDASGTGYFDPVANEYRWDLLAHALKISEDAAREIILPRVLDPHEEAGRAVGLGLPSVVLGPGCGDNAGAALGMGVDPGQTWVSLGTSGVVAAVSEQPWRDVQGFVAGFADATGRFLPLQCTLNGSPVVDRARTLLGADFEEFSELALAAAPGAGGMTCLPFFGGERTPNLPGATGSFTGLTHENITRPNFARAAVEGMLCLLAECLHRLANAGQPASKVLLVGGGTKLRATCSIAPEVFATPVDILPAGEYVARGAARQAAWVLTDGDEPPLWPLGDVEESRSPADNTALTQYRAAFAALDLDEG